jgi:hypothetical protein
MSMSDRFSIASYEMRVRSAPNPLTQPKVSIDRYPADSGLGGIYTRDPRDADPISSMMVDNVFMRGLVAQQSSSASPNNAWNTQPPRPQAMQPQQFQQQQQQQQQQYFQQQQHFQQQQQYQQGVGFERGPIQGGGAAPGTRGGGQSHPLSGLLQESDEQKARSYPGNLMSLLAVS